MSYKGTKDEATRFNSVQRATKIKVGNIIHLLDSVKPDIRFVVQNEADVGRSEAESNISLNLHNKSNVRRGSVQQMFYYAEITE